VQKEGLLRKVVSVKQQWYETTKKEQPKLKRTATGRQHEDESPHCEH
jgi:hypothetical protein